MNQTTAFNPDRFAELRARFEHAWTDLGERIDGGVTALAHMAEQAEGSNKQRLTDKADGLRAAQALYASLNPTGAQRDHGGAWRIFEDSLAALVRAEPVGPRQQGLSLANGYQRGYGPDVDAAPLFERSRLVAQNR